MQLPVRVQGYLPSDIPFAEETVTLVVNAHGALLRLNTKVEMGQMLVLQILPTNESQEARVVFLNEGEAGKFHVGVELIKPNPFFWHVSFPPEDWSPSHPDAKAKH